MMQSDNSNPGLYKAFSGTTKKCENIKNSKMNRVGRVKD